MKTMRPLGLACAGLATLSGCQFPYSVTVNNASSRPVFVSITQDQLVYDPLTLAEVTVSPGEQVSLGPFKVPPTDPMSLLVRELHDPWVVPERVRLASGTTPFRVEDSALETWGRLRLVHEGTGKSTGLDETP